MVRSVWSKLSIQGDVSSLFFVLPLACFFRVGRVRNTAGYIACVCAFGCVGALGKDASRSQVCEPACRRNTDGFDPTDEMLSFSFVALFKM